MTTTRIAVATCAVLPEPDPDQDLLLDALRQASATPTLLAWDDPDAPALSTFDLVVLRSTWNYPQAASAFLAWIDAVVQATRLLNSRDVVRWNIDKRYLLELSDAGIPTIPTVYVERDGTPFEVATIMRERSWDRIVIKPAISASSYLTRTFEAAGTDAAQAFLESTRDARAMLIQPYMTSVDDIGERSLIWIDGAWTHAIRKMPRFDDDEESVSEATAVTEEERTFGATVLSRVPSPESLLYARVDVVRDQQGGLCISEVELIEPSLYLLQHADALHRLVSAIVARATTPR